MTAPSSAPAPRPGTNLAVVAVVAAACLAVIIMMVGVLAAIAIPNFLRYKQRAELAETRVHLPAIAAAENAYFEEHGRYLPAGPYPAAVPASPVADSGPLDEGFRTLGFTPPSPLKHQYAVEVAQGAVRGTRARVVARGDRDHDGVITEHVLELARGATAGEIEDLPEGEL
jgi:type II secretory pathway pseudopilin PulG